MKRPVCVRIESWTDGERSVRTAQGVLYQKGARRYLRYREPDPSMGSTMTTVSWGGGEIRVMRSGDVESRQTFCVGRKMPGTYRIAGGQIGLDTVTLSIDASVDGGAGSIAWNYDLYVGGTYSGRIEIQLVIQEVTAR